MKTSAGILLYRIKKAQLEVFLVHPGGPFWKNKNEGAWSIPKGEYENGDDALEAARREFKEETGTDIDGEFRPLKPVKLKSGKRITAWAVQGDIDAETVVSNTCTVEWPPRSGKQMEIPEVDRGEWFGMAEAKQKINIGQVALLEELAEQIGG
jgi:predicted NUDIX family NTP pyrophosphohydrolase